MTDGSQLAALPDVRGADLRFVLPRPPATVQVVNARSRAVNHAFLEALAVAGVRLVDAAADLVLASSRDVDAVLRLAPEMALLRGRARTTPLRAAGYHVQRLLVLPDQNHPRLVVPLTGRSAVIEALRRPPRSRITRVSDVAAVAMLSAGVSPASRTWTLASRIGTAPWLLRAAADAGVYTSGAWFLWLGDGDALQRAVLHLPSSAGGCIVKFSRVPDNLIPFQREQDAARLLRTLPYRLREHTPTLLHQTIEQGLPILVERRIPGRSMHEVLTSDWPAKLRGRQIQLVANWIHELAEATMVGPERLHQERLRLSRQVLPRWTDGGLAAGSLESLVGTVERVPGVMQHNDLGTWNIVADGHGGFGVIDWESSRPVGLPLWDLLYFLVDAYTCRAGMQTVDRLAEALALLRGDHPDSAALFAQVRRQVTTLDVAPSAVGAVVTLGWLHHGLSAARRVRSLDEHTAGDPAATTSLQAALALPWLNDPALGAGWSAWR